MCGWEGAIDGTYTSSDMVLKNDKNNKHDTLFDKRQLEIYFQSILYNIVKENACHLSKSPIKCIEIIQFAFMCTICSGCKLHHLEGRSTFAPGSKFLKHRSHGQNYTPVTNLHPGCKFAPRCKLRT